MNTIYFIIVGSVIALIGLVYTMLHDPDDEDSKWDMDKAPWRK